MLLLLMMRMMVVAMKIRTRQRDLKINPNRETGSELSTSRNSGHTQITIILSFDLSSYILEVEEERERETEPSSIEPLKIWFFPRPQTQRLFRRKSTLKNSAKSNEGTQETEW